MPTRRRPKPSRSTKVEVLRIGHRPGRDPRLTTHLALVARAFGARALHLNPPDDGVTERIGAVTRRWGGSFRVLGTPDWRRTVREFPGAIVHLTMYGLPMERARPALARAKRLLVVVGGAKVPPDLYGRADYNIAIGHQPHSEVGALAVFLDRILGPPVASAFRGARQRISPSGRGKSVTAEDRRPAS